MPQRCNTMKQDTTEKTFALFITWTEDSWPGKEFQAMYDKFKLDKIVFEDWRVKEYRDVYIGMPVIGYKQRGNGRGVFGIGYISSAPSEPSFNDDGRQLPHRDFKVAFTTLSNPLSNDGPLLNDDELMDILDQVMSSRYSGCAIDIKVYNEIITRIRRKNKISLCEKEALPLGKGNMDGKQHPYKYRPDSFEENLRKTELGLNGEIWVMNNERQKLISAGLCELSTKIEHVALNDDSRGYDIISFDENGEEIFIEVKTTNDNIDTEFFISCNEVEASERYGSKYRLYRVFNFSASPAYFVLDGPIANGRGNIKLQPTNYRVYVGDGQK